jgi:hypothetical protein
MSQNSLAAIWWISFGDSREDNRQGYSPSTIYIHAAQKAPHVPRQGNKTDCHNFDGQTVVWEVHSPSSGAEMHPPYQPDH